MVDEAKRRHSWFDDWTFLSCENHMSHVFVWDFINDMVKELGNIWILCATARF